MNIQHTPIALLFALILLISNAQANLGDTSVQSENRYGQAFSVTQTPTGTIRSYYTLDRKYLVQQIVYAGATLSKRSAILRSSAISMLLCLSRHQK